MKKHFLSVVTFIFISTIGLALLFSSPSVATAYAQQPTVAIATVTGTPIGAYIVVNADQEQINVRSGPGTEYPTVGILVTGEIAPVKGKSVGGLWYQIVYVGVEGGLAWVYGPLVTPVNVVGDLPIVEPPSTPTPRVTPTIDPTLAAQFVLEIPATRLPTFTPVEPLDIPEFEQQGTGRVGGIPIGMFITAIGLMGLFGAAVSYLRER